MKKRTINISTYILIILCIISCSDDNDNIDEPILEPGIVYETFTDNRDGYLYHSIQIGEQTWMAENLAFKANNGYWAYDNDENYVSTYGYLYIWETACSVCPEGWHLPSWDEYDTLINYLGGFEVAGGKMKRTGTAYWNSPNTDATNTSGFNALAGGNRYDGEGGWFDNMGDFAVFWSSTESELTSYKAMDLSLSKNSGQIGSSLNIPADKTYGLSVRCIKD